MRLIDVDALPNYKLIGTMALGSERSPAELRIVLWEDIKSMSTIDAVPVVRCRECKYWRRYTRQWENHCAGECERHRMEGGTYENDFCSYGQRKEDEHEQ